MRCGMSPTRATARRRTGVAPRQLLLGEKGEGGEGGEGARLL